MYALHKLYRFITSQISKALIAWFFPAVHRHIFMYMDSPFCNARRNNAITLSVVYIEPLLSLLFILRSSITLSVVYIEVFTKRSSQIVRERKKRNFRTFFNMLNHFYPYVWQQRKSICLIVTRRTFTLL